MMSWACDMPADLLCRPVGLIVLSGMDLVYNAVHKAIWDSFSNNRRADRVPLKFSSFGIDHEYPKCRTKRTSYEWYIPKGILKSSWMSKHLDHVPAVVVIFFDLDWDEPMWKERQMECATRVEIVRNSLLGRGTKVCMVLIQKNAPLPPGEDLIAAERAASLCSACELSAKSLFVLPLTDHLLGYTIRLENAFFELSQSYYHTEARRVKGHRDFLNKTTHQLLFIRHQFKIAFFNELKQDSHTALKHYKQAYSHVWEQRISDTNLLEVKTIAGFINYKICRLSFQVNTPLDAIAQFRKHIDFFKSKTGTTDYLSIEHSAWMAKQFQMFGDLFDEAIKLGGLNAIQTQHPGFYYQQAAYHSLARKQMVTKLQLQTTSFSAQPTDILEHLNNLDYYGQRPWRQGIQSIDPLDAVKEKDGIAALQALESRVDHSWIIIPLLGSAVAQFKKYKSPRMKRYLMVQMGEEYYYAKDYNRALTLLTRVNWEYRHERWWSLLTSVLVTELQCAYLTASLPDYVTICLELISSYTETTREDKTRLCNNLLKILSGSQPDPEPGCLSDIASSAWDTAFNNSDNDALTIEMSNMASFIECKALFSSESFTADKLIEVRVYLRSSSPVVVNFSKLYVTFSNQLYSSKSILSSSELSIEPGRVQDYTFSFIGHSDDLSNTIEIKSVCLEWSRGPQKCICLHWSGAGGDVITPLQQTGLTKSQPNVLVWEEIIVRPTTRLLYRDSGAVDIDVKHSPPGLVNERYHYAITITNNESSAISDVNVSFSFKDSAAAAASSSSSLTGGSVAPSNTPVGGQQLMTKISADASQQMEKLTLKCGDKLTRDFYTDTLKPSDLILVVSVSYVISVMVGDTSIVCHCVAEQNVCLSIIEPLGFDFEIYNLQYDKLDVVNIDVPFILLTDIHTLTAWPLRIVSSRLNLSDGVSSLDVDQSQLAEVPVKSPSDHVGECYLLNIANNLSDSVSLGQYVITVQRDSDDDRGQTFELVVSLPSVNVTSLPVSFQLSLPTDANVESQLTLVYSLRNNSSILHDVDVSVESSEAFMFAGNRQVHVRIQPHSVHQLTYNLVPLMSGNVNLPKLHISLPRLQATESFAAAIQKMIPTTIFVQPRKRNSAMNIQPTNIEQAVQ